VVTSQCVFLIIYHS
jgi:hypothetical protein